MRAQSIFLALAVVCSTAAFVGCDRIERAANKVDDNKPPAIKTGRWLVVPASNLPDKDQQGITYSSWRIDTATGDLSFCDYTFVARGQNGAPAELLTCTKPVPADQH